MLRPAVIAAAAVDNSNFWWFVVSGQRGAGSCWSDGGEPGAAVGRDHSRSAVEPMAVAGSVCPAQAEAIDVLASPKRNLAATCRFFARALNAARRPTEVTTDRAPAYPRVLDELVPEAWHVVEQYANNPIEADHGGLKARTRPMRGLKRLRSAQVVCSGHAFVQNPRRGHYELGHATEPGRRLEAIFTELALAI